MFWDIEVLFNMIICVIKYWKWLFSVCDLVEVEKNWLVECFIEKIIYNVYLLCGIYKMIWYNKLVFLYISN